MASKPPHLSVATEADAAKAAEKAKPKTLAQAAEGEDYLEILLAQRREMIRDLSDVNGPAKAAMHRQIAMHSKEIAALQVVAAEEAAEDADRDVEDEGYDTEAI